jgi:amino-acid N-acetyltransferase
MKVEKAKISDAQQIYELVNVFADRGEMLPRALSEIYQNLREYFVIRNSDNNLMACVASHISWDDMSEIRSLAVAEKEQTKGLGARLVQHCIEEAKTLDIPTIFCLTYKPGFFEKQGFRIVDKMELPRKIWSECYHCPKFPDCDEVAMIYQLKPDKYQFKKRSAHTISSQQIYDGRAVKLRVDTVLTPSGKKTNREIVEHLDCIVAVPLDADNNVLMVRQYRDAVDKNLLELPAGGIDAGEQPVEAVRRELQEEIGFIPQKIDPIGGFYPSPGYCTEYLYTYVATQLVPRQLLAEDTDEIEVVKIPLAKVPELIASGEICDAKSIICLNYVITMGIKGS